MTCTCASATPIALEHPQAGPDGTLRTATTSMRVTGLHPNPMRVLSYVNPATAATYRLAGVTNLLTVTPAPGTSANAVRRALLAIPHVASAEAVQQYVVCCWSTAIAARVDTRAARRGRWRLRRRARGPRPGARGGPALGAGPHRAARCCTRGGGAGRAGPGGRPGRPPARALERGRARGAGNRPPASRAARARAGAGRRGAPDSPGTRTPRPCCERSAPRPERQGAGPRGMMPRHGVDPLRRPAGPPHLRRRPRLPGASVRSSSRSRRSRRGGTSS